MLRLGFRLGTHGRTAVNFLSRANILNSTRQVTRQPVRILNEESDESLLKPYPEQNRSRSKKKKDDVYRLSKFDDKYYVKSNVNRELEREDTDGNLNKPLWHEEETDYKLSQYMVTVKSRNRRRKENMTMLEGKRLISDAILSGVKVKAVFVSLRSEFRALPPIPYDYKLHWIPYRYFKKWSDTTTPSGLMAMVEIPSTEKTAPDPNALPLTVICDNIRDPGNMGAILRVLAAVGSTKILVTKGCVDIWEPKVLRAGAGGHFRVPIEYDLSWEDINSQLEDDLSIFLADSGNVNINNAAETPCTPSTDSGEEDDNLDNANNVSSIQNVEETPVCAREVLQAVPYYALRFRTSGKNVLVISNEHFGPSKQAAAFTSARQGVKVHIPLCGKVESLNVVSALSIITFEMRRQAALC